MKRPIESDYKSQAAYTRSLEAYCDSLAKPVQEPVGQLQEYAYGRGQVLWFSKLADKSMLYTTPPQSKPLTDEQVNLFINGRGEQEPWMYRIWNDKDAQWQLTDDCSWPAEPIYTTPPQRPWVGLTEEEMQAVVDKQLLVSSINVYFKAIETKLKEKNT